MKCLTGRVLTWNKLLANGFWLLTHLVLPLTLFSQASIPPLEFVENKGQWAQEVHFRAELGQGTVFLSDNHFTYIFEEKGNCSHFACGHESSEMTKLMHSIRVHFEGANPNPLVQGFDKFPTHHNYYLGDDPARWASKVPLYQKVTYYQIYPGIDLKVQSVQGSLKYDLILEPGSDPELCQFRYEGARSLAISPNGDLIIQTHVGAVIEKAPFSYQIIDGEKIEVACHYKLEGEILSFEFPNGYLQEHPLIIDPVLVFGTYSGARASNWGFTATYDKWGNAFGGGIIFNNTYPATLGAFQQSYGGGSRDISLSKFSPDGTQLVFATYLGGNDGEQPHSMVAGPNGELIIYGRTFSENFPTTPFAYDTTYNGSGDLYLTKLDSSGAMIASTFLGGTDADGVINRFPSGGNPGSFLYYNYGDDARGEIVLDEKNNCYIATVTQSQDFPIATLPVDSYSGGLDACIAKLSPNLDQLLWSSYFGGANDDAVYSMKVLREDILYVTGGTASVDFPVTPQSATPSFQGQNDAFVARINLANSTIEASTFLGTGANDQAYFIELDKEGSVFVFGQSEGNMPVIGNVYSNWLAKQFITKLTPQLDQIQLQTVFGTLASPQPDISPTAFLVDNCGRIYVSGWGPLGQFQGRMPLTSDAYQDSTDGTHFYLGVFEKDLDTLIYGTYFAEYDQGQGSAEHVDGGTSRFDKKGIVYHAVCASCGGTSGFPTTPGAYSTSNRAGTSATTGCNMAVFKMDFQLPTVDADFIPEGSFAEPTYSGCNPLTLHFNNVSTGLSTTTSVWDFGDGSPKDSSLSPTHIYTQAGTYEVSLVVSDPNTCNGFDTLVKKIEVYSTAQLDAGPAATICRGDSVQLSASVIGGSQFEWDMAPGLSQTQALTPFVKPVDNQLYFLRANDRGECPVEDSVWVFVKPTIELTLTPDTAICRGTSFVLKAEGAETYKWQFDSSLSALTIPNPIASPQKTTQYTLYGDPDSLCRDTASMTVTVYEVPHTQMWASKTEVCERHLATLYAAGGLTYEWSHSSQTGDSLQIWPRQSRWYYVRAINGTCASKWDSVYIEVYKWPQTGFSAQQSGPFAPMTIQLINNSMYAFRYEWRFGDRSPISTEKNPIHVYQDSGTYTIQLSAFNRLGCRRSTFYTLYVDKVKYFVPNAFSPNDDGYNDQFSILGHGLDQLAFRVFDRWGKLLYAQTGSAISWDGKHKGTSVPEGVYPYTLEVIGLDGLKYVKQGTITVIR